MKEKISITLEEETIQQIRTLRKNPRFRNKSHVVESAVKEMILEEYGRRQF